MPLPVPINSPFSDGYWVTHQMYHSVNNRPGIRKDTVVFFKPPLLPYLHLLSQQFSPFCCSTSCDCALFCVLLSRRLSLVCILCHLTHHLLCCTSLTVSLFKLLMSRRRHVLAYPSSPLPSFIRIPLIYRCHCVGQTVRGVRVRPVVRMCDVLYVAGELPFRKRENRRRCLWSSS